MSGLTIKLETGNGAIPVESFLFAIENAVAILGDIERERLQMPRAGLHWAVSGATMNSPLELVLSPVGPDAEEVARELVSIMIQGLRQIVTSPSIPSPLLTLPNWERVASFKKLFRAGVTGLSVGGEAGCADFVQQNIPSDIDERVARLKEVRALPEGYTRSSTFDGTLEFINCHVDPAEVRIYETLTGRAIKGKLPHELIHQAGNALSERVKIVGRTEFSATHEPVTVQIQEIRLFPAENTLPRPQDLYDIDFTGGMDPEEYVRTLRDE